MGATLSQLTQWLAERWRAERPAGRLALTPARLLRWAVLLLLLGPTALGLAGLVAPALGLWPALGFEEVSAIAWQRWWALPGLADGLRLTLVSGIGGTLLAVLLTMGWLAAAAGTRFGERLERLLAPVLAMPHLALALGLLWLAAPSGVLMRLLLAPFEVLAPAQYPLPDAHGITLALGLALKEAPFLMLMAQTALSRLPVTAQLQAGQALGYSIPQLRWRILMPQVMRAIALPIGAVLAYSLAVVDVAQVLGPTRTPTLAVRLVELWRDSDPSSRLPASVGALLLALLVIVVMALGAAVGRYLLNRHRDWVLDNPAPRAAVRKGQRGRVIRVLLGTVTAVSLLAFAVIAVQSLARSWFFPSLLPARWGLESWQQALSGLGGAFSNSLWLAVLVATLAVMLSVAVFEREREVGRLRGFVVCLYLPLLLPQASFLFGFQVGWLSLGADPGWVGVVIGHLLFALPYAWLTLAGPWARFDVRLEQAARLLGRSRLEVLIGIRLRLMLRPLAISWAVAFAVSIAQYVPTVVLGGGRVPTLTTETLALATGADPRLTAVAACLQACLPLLIFLLARAVPAGRALAPIRG
ncbi:ABC transporter permease [Cobetia marina]|uniref:ABC transporter permease n=1 Tax=Cobetia marina TaxID=28258 RepID=UPI001749041B